MTSVLCRLCAPTRMQLALLPLFLFGLKIGEVLSELSVAVGLGEL